MTGSPYSLRPAADGDREFLEQVYAESRADELARTDWTDEQKAAFCRQQFQAQDTHYRRHHPDCEFLIIEQAGRPRGRLYLDRRADELRIVDIALLTAERGRGLGGRIMADLLRLAAADGDFVRIHVERSNPARRLYDRLGFVLEEEGEVYDLLVWKNPV